MFLHITQAKHIKDYQVHLTFNNGTQGIADLTTTLWGEVFEPLKNPQLFKTLHVDTELGTITWSNGADLAPEFLLSLIKKEL